MADDSGRKVYYFKCDTGSVFRQIFPSLEAAEEDVKQLNAKGHCLHDLITRREYYRERLHQSSEDIQRALQERIEIIAEFRSGFTSETEVSYPERPKTWHLLNKATGDVICKDLVGVTPDTWFESKLGLDQIEEWLSLDSTYKSPPLSVGEVAYCPKTKEIVWRDPNTGELVTA